MDLEDLASALEIWKIDFYESVEPSRSGECGIQDFFLVGRCKNDDISICIKTIHFHEELIQGRISLIISSSTHT